MLENENPRYQEFVNNLPPYLAAFAEPQMYDQYTPENQAVWRYIMRQLTHYFKDHAPKAYFEGLKRAAIPINRIPKIEEMIDGLQEIGWGAICVNGFIPPAAFMEYNANKVLPISADMRSLVHLLYTPAPDIVHEAAGHAPIVADSEYTDFLQKVGEYGSKALSNKYDKKVYEAIRKLSIVKEYPLSTDEEIKDAQDQLNSAITERKKHPMSEAALVSRFHWWTVEYGLLKTDDKMQMYGAGLLSSLGESFNCLDEKVKKIKLNIDCLKTDYDITREQPQLFYVESSKDLFPVLEDLANTMAFRIGGAQSLEKAIECETFSTAVYSSGIQVSGVFTTLIKDSKGREVYLGTTGPTSLSYKNKELVGHDSSYHAHGFSSPVGKLKGSDKPLRELSYVELEKFGISKGKPSTLIFESGVKVEGLLNDIMSRNGQTILMSFIDCTVTGPSGESLFEPAWGTYDMAVGDSIESVFGGPADKKNYNFINQKSDFATPSIQYNEDENKVFEIYTALRDMRETDTYNFDEIHQLYKSAESLAPKNWLLKLEMVELLKKNGDEDSDLEKEITTSLLSLKKESEEFKHLIDLGLKLASAQDFHE